MSQHALTHRPRSGAIDLVRVLALIAVVAGHVWEGGIVAELVYPWHVPIFFILTGYLWTAGRPLRVEVRKRWNTLLIPYIAWLLIIWSIYAAQLTLRGEASPWKMITPFIGGIEAVRPFTAFWFVTVLFFSCIAFRLLERLPRWSQWAIAIISVATTYVLGNSVAHTPLGVGEALPCVLFLLIGTEFRKHRSRLKRPILLGALFVLAGAVLVASKSSTPLDLKLGNFGVPILGVITATIISIGIILIAESAVPALPRTISQVATTLAGGGILVVLTHAAVLWVLRTPPTGNTIHFLIALVIPWAFALLLMRTRMAPWLLGTAQHRAAKTSDMRA